MPSACKPCRGLDLRRTGAWSAPFLSLGFLASSCLLSLGRHFRRAAPLALWQPWGLGRSERRERRDFLLEILPTTKRQAGTCPWTQAFRKQRDWRDRRSSRSFLGDK